MDAASPTLRLGGNVPLAALLLLSLVLNATGITWGLPNVSDWAIDSVAPYDVIRAAASGFSDGWWSKYPPLHLALLALLYLPVLGWLELTGRDVDWDAPFLGLADPLPAMSALILVSRLVSVLMGTAIVLFVSLTGRELFGRRTGLFAGLIVALYYPLVFYAHTANLDVPYLFWSAAAVLAFTKVLRRGAGRDYVLFALFATFAVCTKDQAYGIFALAPVAVLWTRWTESGRNAGTASALRVLADRRNLLAAATAIAAFALIHNLAFNASGFLEHVRFIKGRGSEPWQEFPASLAGRIGLVDKIVEYLGGNLGPPLFVAVLGGAVYGAIRYPRECLPLLLLAASYVLTFLEVVLYVMQRFALPVAILLAIPAGKLLDDVWVKMRWPAARLAVVVAFLPPAALCIQLDVLFLRDSRYAAERWLEERTREGDTVETFAPPSETATYYPRFPERVEVRRSRLAAATTWAARTGRRDPPDADTGTDLPDYIVLSEFRYGQVERGDPADPDSRALKALFGGRLGYALAAEFKTVPFIPLRDLLLNPRILIFRRTSNEGEPKRPPEVVGGTLRVILPATKGRAPNAAAYKTTPTGRPRPSAAPRAGRSTPGASAPRSG